MASAAAPEGTRRFEGRFTPADGVRGWLLARYLHQPFYGAGSLEARPEAVTLRGWQRTWLGTGEAVEVAFAPSQVRNAASRDATVRFEARIGRRWRNVEFTLPDAATATEVVGLLPSNRTEGFDEAWAGLQEFNRAMAAQPGRPWVTPALALANLAVFVAMLVQSGGPFIDPQEMLRWANAGLLTTRGEWWRLLTAVFLHWNFAHLALNMWALLNAGRITERLYGSATFLGLYLASGVIGSLASLGWNPAVSSAGASGAVFGVLGALLACMLRDNGLPRVIVKAHRWSTLSFVVLNLVLGAVSTNTDNAAHVGGLVTGFLLGGLLARPIRAGGRADLRPAKVATAAGIVALALGLGLYGLQGPAPASNGPYAWTKRHGEYVTGEIRHYRDATKLDWKLNSGQISPADYAAAIRQDLLPFLQRSVTQFEREHASATDYHTLALRFVRARRDWLTQLADAIDSSNDEDSKKAAQLQEATEDAKSRLDVAQLREQFDGRPGGVRLWLLDAYWSRKLAGPAQCVQPPEILRYVASATDAHLDGPARRRDAGCAAQRSLIARDYGGLERVFEQARATLADLPDGSSTYAGLTGGLNDLMEYGRLPPEVLLQRFSEWRRAHPRSVLPDLLEADLYHEAAWAARGHGFAKQVRAQDWQLFRYRVSLAHAILADVADRARDQPYWYTSAISVGLDGKDSRETMRATFDEGARRFPTYLPVYRAMLRVLMPRWNGSSEEVADFIDQAAFTRSDAVYARLYLAYATLEGDDVDIYRNARVDWARIRGGLERLRAEHPQSDYIVNAAAWMACRKGDADAFSQVREAALERPSFTAWSAKYTLSSCDDRFDERERTAVIDAEAAPIAPVGGRVDARGRVLTAADAEWVKRQAATALEAAEPVRVAITHYVERHGALPSDEVLRQSPEFRAVNPMGAVVEIGLGASINMKLAGGPLDGHKFSWTPYLSSDQVRWQCAQETVPEEYLGAPCR